MEKIHTMVEDDNGVHGIYYLNKTNLNKFDINEYLKICIIRNPYERLISGIIQRSKHLIVYENYQNMNVSKLIEKIKRDNCVDVDKNHFNLQSSNLLEFKFDKVIDIKNMSELNVIFNFDTTSKHGGHDTKYTDVSQDYNKMTLEQIAEQHKNKSGFSKQISSWFTEKDIKVINEMYEEDFKFAESYDIYYEKL